MFSPPVTRLPLGLVVPVELVEIEPRPAGPGQALKFAPTGYIFASAGGIPMKQKGTCNTPLIKRWWVGYTVAVGGTIIAALARWALGEGASDLTPYMTFYPVAFAAALVGGTGPGLLATVLSVLAGNILFMQPVGKIGPATLGQAVGMGLFVAVNATFSVLAGRLRAKSHRLEESQARLQLAHQAAHMGAFEWNIRTGVNNWTPELETMYGLKPGEFARTEPAWERFVHPEDRDKAVAAVKRALETLKPEEGEWRVVWPDGSIHWLVGRFQAFTDRMGKVSNLVGVNIDITARKEAEQALRQSARRFRALETAGSYAVYRMNPDWSEMQALDGRNFIADSNAPIRNWLEKYIDPRDQPDVLATINKAIRNKAVFEFEHRVRRADGTLGWTYSRAVPVRDEDGEIIEWVGTASDITSRKESEQAVRQSEEHFRTMADAIPQLAWIARADGYVFWYNRRSYEFTGATLEQLEGWGWQSVVHPRALPWVMERWKRSIATGEPYNNPEAELRGADGQYRPFLTLAVPLKDNEGKVLLWFGTHTNISAQKRAEAEIIALRDRLAADLDGMNRLHALSTRFVSEGDLQSLLQAILDAAIALTGGDKGHVQLFDPASGRLELADERGFGSAFAEYSSHIRPGVLASGIALETHQRVVVEDISVSPHYQADPSAMNLLLSAGMRSVICIPLLTRSEQLLGALSVLFATPHRPSERHLRLLDLLARQAADILERTRADNLLRAARQQLADANADLERKVEERTAKLREAMAELEHMSYGMIHDMRAPLRAMQGYAEILHEECEECRRPPASNYVRIIRESCNRLDRLVIDALNYNKVVRGNLPLTSVNLGALLRGMVHTYPNLQHAEIVVEFAELVVLGNESLLTQCFGNLLDNAVKFVAEGVRPQVRVWAQPSATDNQAATSICVEDNGIGIPMWAQEKIFGMFQRMHPESEYPGTGIGLTIARKAVERMNGRISIRSEPGKGTRIHVELPRPVKTENKVTTLAVA